MNRWIGLLVLAVVLLSGCGSMSVLSDSREQDYQYAISLINNYNMEAAEPILSKIGDYKDAPNILNYVKAKLIIKNTETDKLKDVAYPAALRYLNKIPANYDGMFKEEIGAFHTDIEKRNSEFSFIISSPKGDPNAPKFIDYSNMKPQIGMTAEQVVKTSWGKPKDINKTTTTSGVSEQWVYELGKYVYLDNGIVIAIQE